MTNMKQIIQEIVRLDPNLTPPEIKEIIIDQFYQNSLKILQNIELPKLIKRKTLIKWNLQKRRTPNKRLKKRENLEKKNRIIKEYYQIKNILNLNIDNDFIAIYYNLLNSNSNTTNFNLINSTNNNQLRESTLAQSSNKNYQNQSIESEISNRELIKESLENNFNSTTN
ncbi:MAG: hypothetical protein ACTSXF_15055, partial [Promethearchaeota archaeon]